MSKSKAKQNEPKQDETKPVVEEPIYLRDTIIEMQTFKDYGFDKYMLRALLPENTYTLNQAKALVEAYINRK